MYLLRTLAAPFPGVVSRNRISRSSSLSPSIHAQLRTHTCKTEEPPSRRRRRRAKMLYVYCYCDVRKCTFCSSSSSCCYYVPTRSTSCKAGSSTCFRCYLCRMNLFARHQCLMRSADRKIFAARSAEAGHSGTFSRFLLFWLWQYSRPRRDIFRRERNTRRLRCHHTAESCGVVL